LARKGATSTRIALTATRDCASADPAGVAVTSTNAPQAAIAARRVNVWRHMTDLQSPARPTRMIVTPGLEIRRSLGQVSLGTRVTRKEPPIPDGSFLVGN
jgi:hypothetical protein